MTFGERERRQYNLEDTKSDQESVSTSSETLLSNKIAGQTKREVLINNKYIERQPLCKKLESLMKRNWKAGSVLSVVEQYSGVIEEESDKKTTKLRG